MRFRVIQRKPSGQQSSLLMILEVMAVLPCCSKGQGERQQVVKGGSVTRKRGGQQHANIRCHSYSSVQSMMAARKGEVNWKEFFLLARQCSLKGRPN